MRSLLNVLSVTKTLKAALFAFVMFGVNMASRAQEIVTSDMTVTKPISLIQLSGTNYKTDPSSNKATIRVFTFGKYITYELEVAGSFFEEAHKSAGTTGDKNYFTWSGSTDWMNVGHITSPNTAYLVLDSQRNMDGMLGMTNNIWVVLVSGKVGNCVTDIHTGSTLDEIKESIKGLSSMMTIKETGTVDGLKEYTAFGAALHDDPIYSNRVNARNDDPYAKFYFGADGKLVKWYMMKR